MAHLAHLRRLARLPRSAIELLALADQPLEPADVLQERVGALVLARSGLGGLAGARRRGLPRRRRRCGARRSRRRFSRSARLRTYWTPVEREHGLAHLALAGLDLLGDRDLLLAGEERDAAHLLEVHADRIGGFAGSALGLLGLRRLLGPLGLGRPSRASPSASAVSSTASTSMSMSPSIETTWSSSSAAAGSAPTSRGSSPAGERGSGRASRTRVFFSAARFSMCFTVAGAGPGCPPESKTPTGLRRGDTGGLSAPCGDYPTERLRTRIG